MNIRRASVGPRYSLSAAQRAETRMSQSCIEKANQLLQMDDTAARRYVSALFLSITSADFAHVETMRPRYGGVLLGDVYGKVDDFGLWFVKFRYDPPNSTVILSCKEAEHDLTLRNGRILRKKR